MPHNPTSVFAAVGTGKSSPLGNVVLFCSFSPGKHSQGVFDDCCIVIKLNNL